MGVQLAVGPDDAAFGGGQLAPGVDMYSPVLTHGWDLPAHDKEKGAPVC